jgi:hypothetical protein
VSASPKRRKVASPHPSPSTKKVAVSPAAASRPASNVFDEIEEDMVDYEDEE